MQESQQVSSQSAEAPKVAIVACAGMDKALGSVARTTAFIITEKLRPNSTILICIPPLVADVKPYSELIKRYPVVTIDGCAERCATKIVAKTGAKIRGRVFVPQSAQTHNLKPNTASDIGPEGEKLAEKIAEETALLINKLCER
ncbi:putative zinc-binding protein [Candidatus Bathyarchaeota archaeon]|nr:putative zinc-binding protein [Candidatus Bathyarchaeota archaeon]